MRIVLNGRFRARRQRRALPMEAFCPARGGQCVVEGFAFRYGLRCMLVVFWGKRAREPWYCLTNVSALEVEGSWYRYRGWMEQGFRQLKRGGWGWHRTRVEEAERVFLDWLV